MLAAAVAITALAHGQTPARATDVDSAGDLLCELRASGSARRGSADTMMLVIERLDNRVRVVSSRRAIAREAMVRSGETGVHFVEDVNGSVRVTSLLYCESPGASRPADGPGRSEAESCQRWSAVQSWHFDTAVHRDPDGSFRRLPGTSYRGSCEPWHLGPRRELRAGSER